MARRKSNEKVRIEKDPDKSYVYIYEKNKLIGILMWHYERKDWVFEKDRKRKKKTKRGK